MYRIKLVLKYLKSFWNYVIHNESLRLAFYEIAVSKYVFGNKFFKDFIESQNVVEKLEVAQKQIDRATRLLDNTNTEKAVSYINAQKNGPFKDIMAKLAKNRHGGSNHGIELGFSGEVSGLPVKLGLGFGDDKKIKIGPLDFKF